MKTKRSRKFLTLSLLLLVVILSCTTIIILKQNQQASAPSEQITETPPVEEEPLPEVIEEEAFDKSQHSTTDPNSLWIVVNKQHPFDPINYYPNDLITTYGATIRSIAQADFEEMMAAAAAANAQPTIVSSYRPYDYQLGLYSNYVAMYGQAQADSISARAGYSEHQTGLAVDFGSHNQTSCDLNTCYQLSAEGAWLAENSWKYGFILRFPEGKEEVTGYQFEPWHFRYVGRELAAEMNAEMVTTMEEFFGISGGASY